jgi:hypothetical protein
MSQEHANSNSINDSKARERESGRDVVFGLDQAALEVASGNMLEADVAREGAEERDSVPDEHGDARDDEPLDKSGGKEPLNGNPTVNI